MSLKLSLLLSLLAFSALSLSTNANNHITMVTGTGKTNTTTGQIAVYWGRDYREGTLEETCSTKNYQIVIIAFLSNFGGDKTPELILDTRCNPENNGLTKDIQACQMLGVKILLSIGGPPGSYSLEGNEDGTKFADYLWDTFLGGSSNSRPFGAAALDGVDFDIRGGGLYYTSVAEKLSEKNKDSKKVYISASMPCLYPPNRMAGTVSSGLLDYVWVQFNNMYGDKNSCEYNHNDVSPFKAAWEYWTSQNVDKVFLGALAWIEAGVCGFIEKEEINSWVLPYIKSSPKYGGVAIWNRYYDLQAKYSEAIKAQV